MSVDVGTRSEVGTTLPRVDGMPQAGSRRNLSPIRQSDVLAIAGALASGLGITWMLFTELAPFGGPLGFIVVWYLAFTAAYAVLVSLDENRQAVIDRLASVLVHSLAGLLLTGLVFVLGYVLFRGASALIHPNFYVDDLATTGPLQPLTQGGVLHGIVGTLEQITISLVITVPLGLTCAVYLNEFRGPVPRFVRTIVEAMTALPSIVAGLFIFSLWILALGFLKSGFAAALALSIMMLPIIIRAADVVLRLVPGSLKEASLALGSGQWRTIWHVTLPTARSGLATAVILGTARGIGETSPVLLTAGYAQATNVDAFNGPQVSLPLLAFSLYNSPSDQMRARAFGSAAVLLVMVLGLFITARTVGGRGPGNLTKRQAARRTAQSRADAERFGGMAGDPSSPAAPVVPWFGGVSATGREGGVSAAKTSVLLLDEPADDVTGDQATDVPDGGAGPAEHGYLGHGHDRYLGGGMPPPHPDDPVQEQNP